MMEAFLKYMRRWACGLSDAKAKEWGARLGRWYWYIIPNKRRRLSVENILLTGITDDVAVAKQIARASAERFGPMSMDVLRFPLETDGKLFRRVRWENVSVLDELRASGTGAIIAGSHAGNWEIFSAALGGRFDNFLAVGLKQTNAAFDQFIRETRAMMGATVIYPEQTRDILRRLDRGSFVALLYDQGFDYGILAPLFETMAQTVTGPAHFSYLRKVPIVPVHIFTDGDEYVMRVGQPMYTDRSLGKKQAIYDMTKQLNEVLEDRVREAPADWFWMHNRWKWTRRLHGDPKELYRVYKEQEDK